MKACDTDAPRFCNHSSRKHFHHWQQFRVMLNPFFESVASFHENQQELLENNPLLMLETEILRNILHQAISFWPKYTKLILFVPNGEVGRLHSLRHKD